MKKYQCPVCNYNLLFQPWEGENPSNEICPSCGIQFGCDDMRGGSFREGVYHGWKNKWILDGKPFWRDLQSKKEL